MSDDDKPLQNAGRLAFRREGEWWVAYYAKTGTMDGAIKMGTVRMGIVRDPERKADFMRMMQAVVTDFLKVATGDEPTWHDPVPGPESERAGNA